MKEAILAAGCFWGVESKFMKLEGVISTKVGYTGGTTENPTYEEVCSGTTKHAEAILVEYDEKVLSYEKVLDFFFEIHNPTTKDRQGFDFGSQYRSSIFYQTEEEKDIAIKKIEELNKSDKFSDEVVTEVVKFSKFFDAEDYHQRYIEKRNSL